VLIVLPSVPTLHYHPLILFVVIGMSDILKTLRFLIHIQNLIISSLLHLDTIFKETAMQNKHAKG